jgi:hypothetical protein
VLVSRIISALIVCTVILTVSVCPYNKLINVHFFNIDLTLCDFSSRKNPHLVITPYSIYRGGTLPRGFMPLKKRFDYIIIDEAHKVKNNESNTRINIQRVIGTTPHILLLTGTPLLNRLKVIFQIDHRLDPGIILLILLYLQYSYESASNVFNGLYFTLLSPDIGALSRRKFVV